MKWMSSIFLSLCSSLALTAQVYDSGYMPHLSQKGDLLVAAATAVTGSYYFSPGEYAAFMSSNEINGTVAYSPLPHLGVLGRFNYHKLYWGEVSSNGSVRSGEMAIGSYQHWDIGHKGRYILLEGYMGFGMGKSKMIQWDGGSVDYTWLRSSVQPSVRIGFGQKFAVGTALRLDARHLRRISFINEPVGFDFHEVSNHPNKLDFSLSHIIRLDVYLDAFNINFGITPDYVHADIGFFVGVGYYIHKALNKKTTK